MILKVSSEVLQAAKIYEKDLKRKKNWRDSIIVMQGQFPYFGFRHRSDKMHAKIRVVDLSWVAVKF